MIIKCTTGSTGLTVCSVNNHLFNIYYNMYNVIVLCVRYFPNVLLLTGLKAAITHPFITERMLMGGKESKQTNKGHFKCESGIEKYVWRIMWLDE